MLPAEPYAYAAYRRRCRVCASTTSVEVHGHFVSVPAAWLIREVVEHASPTRFEIFHAGQRVAAHPRSALKRRHTTTPEHMPSAATGATLAGRQRECCHLRLKSGQERPRWSRPSCAPSCILSMASGRAWAFCGWPRPMAKPGSKRPAGVGLIIGAHLRLGRVDSAPGLDRGIPRDDVTPEAGSLAACEHRGRGYYYWRRRSNACPSHPGYACWLGLTGMAKATRRSATTTRHRCAGL